MAGAVDYEIQVDDSSTIAAPFVANQILSASQVTLGALPVRQRWWRVRARNAGGVFGSYSAVRRFTVQTSASLASVAVNPMSVIGGSGATGTVTLTAAAPASGVAVSLSSSSGTVGVPSSVTVSAGATSATFPISTGAVATTTTTTISALYAGVSRTVSLAVNPAGINVTVGGNQSASFAANTVITLGVASGRSAIWSGACSSGGNKVRTRTLTVTVDAAVTGNVQ